MPSLQLYDKLLQFTLFQGMSHADLMQVVTHTKLGFSKIPAGKRVVREGETCRQLIFVINGTIQAETQSDDHAYRTIEELGAPYMLQPGHLFGLNQRYTTSFRTLTDCNFITIDKQEVMLLLETQLVFRLNMLNLIGTEAQRLAHQPWRTAPKSLRERITRFLLSHVLYPAGPKTFYMLMQRLADEVGDSRLDVSRVLNGMQADGLIRLSRGRIQIPMIERLLM